MKKILMILACCVVLCGCGGTSGVSQEEYDRVVAERDEYKTQLDALLNQESESELNEEQEDFSPQLSETDLNSQMDVKEYSFINSINTTWYVMEITNNSPVTVSIDTNVTAKDGEGNVIGAASSSESAVESGFSVCLAHMFDEGNPESYDYTMSVKQEEWYKPVVSDLSYDSSDTGNKVIVSCTNNGTEPAEFVEGTVLFFTGDKLIGRDTNYFTDDNSELKPGNTIAKEFDCYADESYDNFKVYLTGRR